MCGASACSQQSARVRWLPLDDVPAGTPDREDRLLPISCSAEPQGEEAMLALHVSGLAAELTHR